MSKSNIFQFSKRIWMSELQTENNNIILPSTCWTTCVKGIGFLNRQTLTYILPPTCRLCWVYYCLTINISAGMTVTNHADNPRSVALKQWPFCDRFVIDWETLLMKLLKQCGWIVFIRIYAYRQTSIFHFSSPLNLSPCLA